MNATLAELIARLPARLARWAPQFYAASLCYELDPFLLAAICDRESRGGEALHPPGPTGFGDFGHGRGLMQVDDRSHEHFLKAVFDDGAPLWQDPAFNILYAARLLAKNLALLEGDEPAAVAAYNAGVRHVLQALSKAGIDPIARMRVLDSATANGNYVSDVLKKRDGF